MMNWEIELTRNNVTPAKFFAEIRFACKKKGIDFGLDLEQFANPVQQYNSRYTTIAGSVCVTFCVSMSAATVLPLAAAQIQPSTLCLQRGCRLSLPGTVVTVPVQPPSSSRGVEVPTGHQAQPGWLLSIQKGCDTFIHNG